jgi:hypothetical protein
MHTWLFALALAQAPRNLEELIEQAKKNPPPPLPAQIEDPVPVVKQQPKSDVTVIAALLGMTCPFIAMFAGVWFLTRKKPPVDDSDNEAFLADVQAKVDELNASPAEFLERLRPYSEERARAVYVPRKDEHVLWTAFGMMCKVGRRKTMTTSVAASMKILGPVRLRAAGQVLPSARAFELQPTGWGTIVITDQRIYFDAPGMGENWSKTWSSISRVDLLFEGIQLEMMNGAPIILLAPTDCPVHSHPAFIGAVIEHVLQGNVTKA